MNRTRISLTAALLSLCLLLSGCMMPPAEGTVTSFSLEAIPAWSGEPYVAVDGNQPDFPEEDMTSVSFETYSELDTLGRCGVAYANVGQDLMPTEDRESISSVTPSGWINREYDGEYLYNRCHLIGFQLTGENANEENLITGTRYMNVDGMLPFENLVADYVKETDNHVLYRVTPVFEGQNLVASGVQMEAWSVEDEGEGVCFNVYVYNVQPGITIDYATGEGLDDIKHWINGRLCAFCGNSGVGKSTLLNALLPDVERQTAAISQKLGRGRHTTREVTIFEAFGGRIADTPGFASLEASRAGFIPKENLEHAFPEFGPYLGACQFTGCSHRSEKGCAVRAALAEGKLSQTRYDSYCAMYDEVKDVKEWQRRG